MTPRSFLVLLLFCTCVFGDDSNTLNTYIRQTLENLREKMQTGMPEMGMPPLEPLKIPVINEHIKEGVADVKLKLQDLTIAGLSKFNVRKVQMDMATMKLELGIFLPTVLAGCNYDLDGKVLIFPLYGKGPAQFQIVDFDLSVSTTLQLGASIQMSELDIKISTGAINAVFEGILGGGNLGDLVNTILNMLGKKLFDMHKGDIETALNGVLRNVINDQLKKLNPGDLNLGYSVAYNKVNADANNYVDQILKNLRPQLKKYDPVALPRAKDGFEKKVGFIKVKGSAELQTGTLRGLSSLHRVGNVILSADSNSGDLSLDASLGIQNLQVKYKCKLSFMGVSVHPHLSGVVKAVNARAVVKVNLVKNTKKLESFKITKIERPSVKVSNFGPLGHLASFIIKLAIKPIMNKVRGVLEKEVRKLLAEQIAKAQLPNLGF